MKVVPFDLTFPLNNLLFSSSNSNKGCLNFEPKNMNFTAVLPINTIITLIKSKHQNLHKLEMQKICSIIPRSASINHDAVELYDFQFTSSKNQQCESIDFYHLLQQTFFLTESQHILEQETKRPQYGFYVLVGLKNVRKKTIQIQVCIRQQNIALNLKPLAKGKFIKNQKLIQVLKSDNHDWGLLSMDQAQRIMIMGKQCEFPVIGLWQKTEQDINHISAYNKICNFLCEVYPIKCQFVSFKTSYIYYARFKNSQCLPELYLVKWTEGKEIVRLNKLYHINLNSGKNDLTITTTGEFSDEDSIQKQLQFTLRHKQNEKQQHEQKHTSLDCYSPIKQFNNDDLYRKLADENRLGKQKQNLLNEHLSSPSFNNLTGEGDRNVLVQRIKQQDEEIKDLKQEVRKLKAELKYYSQSTNESNSVRKNILIKSPFYEPYHSTAKIKKKLTESDLKGLDSSWKQKRNLENNETSAIKATQSWDFSSKKIFQFLQEEDPLQNVQIIG